MTANRQPVRIRLARADDAPAYRELRLAALRDHPEAFGADYAESEAREPAFWQERLRSQPDAASATFVAEAGGTLIGMTTVVREQGAKVQHGANIYAVYVHPAWRGRRVGEQLLSAAAAWASARGVSQLKLSVTVTNGSAQRLYERCGFTPYGRDPRVIRVGDTYYDELLMVRRLDAADATL
jgi:ribosomal protein S18 acetylase RimI-like enzyme